MQNLGHSMWPLKKDCWGLWWGERRQFQKEYYSLSCRYQDYNSIMFDETTVELWIFKFAGSRQIEMLTVFLFAYYSQQLAIEAELIECGQKFVKLMGTHYCHCKNSNFHMMKNESFQMQTDSCIIIDAAFFWEMNSNYS